MIPPLKLSQTHCVMAQALAMGLPGKLEKLGPFLGLEARKDMAGSRVMKRLSKPHKPGKPYPAEAYEILYEYCKTDVWVEKLVDDQTEELSPSEREIWLLDQVINNRGVRIDRPMALRALEVIEAEKETIKKELMELTEEEVTSPAQGAALLRWVHKFDLTIENMKKDTVAWHLKHRQEESALTTKLHPKVLAALELRQRFSKTSTAKISRILKCACDDDRVRGIAQYYGAGTGRWAGRLFQMQNMFKAPYDDPEPIIDQIFEWLESDMTAYEVREAIFNAYGDVLTAIASCTRGLIIADEGCDIGCMDYSNIEGRITAWLAGVAWKIEAFREFDAGIGPDLYKLAFAKTFNVGIDQVDKSKRSVGKTMELALGYLGSVGSWRKFDAKVPYFDDAAVTAIVKKWRAAHPEIPKLGDRLKKAALQAIRNPGKVYNGGTVIPVLYSFQEGYLLCKLPSDRIIFYPKARIELGEYGDEVVYEACKGTTGKLKEIRLWPGMMIENVVQALARDILAAAMIKVNKEFPILFTVHDEIGASILKGCQQSLDRIGELMCAELPWAKGLPLAVAGWMGKRYKKDA